MKQETSREANKIMGTVIAKTGSTIAYVAAVHDNQQDVMMLAWSSKAMSGCNMAEKKIDYHISKMGLWGDAMREKKVIVTNDYATEKRPSKHGYPAGHIQIIRHMNSVVMNGTKIVGIIGVANRSSDYTEQGKTQFEEYLKSLSSVFAEIQKDAFAK